MERLRSDITIILSTFAAIVVGASNFTRGIFSRVRRSVRRTPNNPEDTLCRKDDARRKIFQILPTE